MNKQDSTETRQLRKERQSLTIIQLGIDKESHKVQRVSRLDLVALKMQSNVAESGRITVYIQRLNRRIGRARVLDTGQLASKVLRKVRGCYQPLLRVEAAQRVRRIARTIGTDAHATQLEVLGAKLNREDLRMRQDFWNRKRSLDGLV